MTTLVRERSSLTRASTSTTTASDDELHSNVPTPFPKELAQEILNEVAPEEIGLGPLPVDAESGTSHVAPPTLEVHDTQVNSTVNREVGPSLTHVEQSCLMTLNNLLSQDADVWQPIVPARRHSLPAHSPTQSSANFQTLLTVPTPSSALHTLVSNLRHRYDSQGHDVETDRDDASLLRELDYRVTSLIDNGTIQARDAPLAHALVSLLTHLNRLSTVSPDDSAHRSPVDAPQSPAPADIYDTLRRRVSELQSHRDALTDTDDGVERPPRQAVEHAILWHKIDNDLDDVFRLCRERADPVQRPRSPDATSLPPEYDVVDYEPPIYDPTEYSETAAAKAAQKLHPVTSSSHTSQTTPSIADEKMRLDLEAVTMAIDRLYLVAPQLSNQRVELKRAKLEQMEQARANGNNISGETSKAGATRRKGKAMEILGSSSKDRSWSKVHEEADVRDLEKMLELISKASTRRIDDQSVILDGERGMADRIEKARLRDLQKRDAFHERLVNHSNTRRLTSQDAEHHRLQSNTSVGSKIRNPDAMLTLPEFIRETIPESVEQVQDPEALLTLPEFVREPPPSSAGLESGSAAVGGSGSRFKKKSFGSSRSRSLSAPPLTLAWLMPGYNLNARTSSSPATESDSNMGTQRNGRSSPLRVGLDVQYVAELQENLGGVAVFLQMNSRQPAVDVEAEVFPSGDERLIVKCGGSTSAPLALPARVAPGRKEVTTQGSHLELKLECATNETNSHGPPSEDIPASGSGLLDAHQLKALNPTSFSCASCSLPLIQSSKLSRYDDLPSEHWSELLEAWMCHSDQKLTESLVPYTKDLWPAPGQALVGGSYLLFEESCLVSSNLRVSRRTENHSLEDWESVRCLCGAMTGRCRKYVSSDDTTTIMYRLAKYAIRPVGSSSESVRIPLSAFILQDMDDLVHAHATYRFVLSDEEEEKPRLLVWMFKPHIRISYATSNHYLMARSASINAAKIHFKVLGPSVSPTIKSTVEKFPHFAQSERLLYPLDICRRLAALLKESNTAYPQARRVMGGLDVGWLQRV